jgi:hypothetical protein
VWDYGNTKRQLVGGSAINSVIVPIDDSETYRPIAGVSAAIKTARVSAMAPGTKSWALLETARSRWAGESKSGVSQSFFFVLKKCSVVEKSRNMIFTILHCVEYRPQ